RALRISAGSQSEAPNYGIPGGAPQSIPIAAIISAGSQSEAPNLGTQGGAPQFVPAAIDNQNNTDPTMNNRRRRFRGWKFLVFHSNKERVSKNQSWWKDRHATRIKAIWRSKYRQHLRNTFWDAQKENRKSPFVSLEDWVLRKRHWETNDKFKHISETNNKSRATEGHNGFSNYTGGSRSVVENVKEIISVMFIFYLFFTC
ncbi:hypothetical protein V2J09_015838, partial [Rumex salicifolius]